MVSRRGRRQGWDDAISALSYFTLLDLFLWVSSYNFEVGDILLTDRCRYRYMPVHIRLWQAGAAAAAGGDRGGPP